jgi:hypothetical protein
VDPVAREFDSDRPEYEPVRVWCNISTLKVCAQSQRNNGGYQSGKKFFGMESPTECQEDQGDVSSQEEAE